MRILNTMLCGLVLVCALMGCGSSSVSTTSPVFTSLHVVRPLDMNSFFQPLDRTITDKQAIQRVYTEALELPSFPDSKAIICPADFGIVYHLTFLHGTNSIHTMNISVTGCQNVQIDHVTSRKLNAAFTALVAKTLDIPSLTPSSECIFQHKC